MEKNVNELCECFRNFKNSIVNDDFEITYDGISNLFEKCLESYIKEKKWGSSELKEISKKLKKYKGNTKPKDISKYFKDCFCSKKSDDIIGDPSIQEMFALIKKSIEYKSNEKEKYDIYIETLYVAIDCCIDDVKKLKSYQTIEDINIIFYKYIVNNFKEEEPFLRNTIEVIKEIYNNIRKENDAKKYSNHFNLLKYKIENNMLSNPKIFSKFKKLKDEIQKFLSKKDKIN
ncbi:MAG: hypothetical protein Q4B84_00375 [Clostridia bacterium]|nr:hypothetical protein [Clostridia bacterium]